MLFVVNHPTPDSTTLSAFVGGRLARRLMLPLPSNVARFLSADVPSGNEGEPPSTRVFAIFHFEAPAVAFSVLWNHNDERWAAVIERKADGSRVADGDVEWFGSEIIDAQYPQEAPEDILSNRARDRDSRRLVMSESTSLRVDRQEHISHSAVSYQLSVYNGDVGPMQRIEGIVSGSYPDLSESEDQAEVRPCAGLPAVTDINSDGHADFWLCESQAVNGEQIGTFWIYDPAAGLFVRDLAFNFQGAYTFDPVARTLREAMAWSAGRVQTHNVYDLSSGVPVLVREQKREVDYDCSACPPRFTTRERQGGTMRVTESRSGTTDEFLPDDFL